MKVFQFITICLLLTLFSCKSKKLTSVALDSVEGEILMTAINAHGGKLYDNAHYEFTFRGNAYSFKNEGDNYLYTSRKQKEDIVVIDELTNLDFKRNINGEMINLTESEKKRFGASLNSVIYFATLPHKLQDPSVNLKSMGGTTIKDQKYNVLEITFDKEGGGQDHDDEYYYWINAKTNLIDYLAYNYQVNNGGVRFRSAYNTRNVGGIVFQDYVNYKAPVGTPLSELPQLFVNGELKMLSVIETESIKKK